MTNADDEIEPIDVLLEEVLREPAAPARAGWGPRLLAAAVVLLGIGSVVGAFVWRHREPPTPKFVQQPQDPNAIVPKDRADFDRLLATATGLRVVRKEVVGTTRESPASEHLDFEAWGQTLDIGGEDLAAWRRDLAASGAAGEWSGVDVVLDVHVLLPGGKQIVCFVTFATEGGARAKAAFGLGGDGLAPLQPNDALMARLRAANDELERRHRRALGIARTIAELADLPEESTTVDCPAGEPAALRQALGRFPRLKSLRLRQSAAAGAPRLDGAVLRAVANLPLSTLSIDAGSLTDADLDAVVAMIPLRRLLLRHGGPGLTGSGLRVLSKTAVTSLVLDSCDGLTEAGVGALATLLRIRHLVLFHPNDALLGFARSQLRTLPELTSLMIWSSLWTDADLRGLAETKIDTLWLGEARLTEKGIEDLAALPSLRFLFVAGTELGDAEVPAFARLTRLTGLSVINGAFTADGAAAVRDALPKCELSIQPGTRLLDLGGRMERILRD